MTSPNVLNVSQAILLFLECVYNVKDIVLSVANIWFALFVNLAIILIAQGDVYLAVSHIVINVTLLHLPVRLVS